MVRCAYEAAAFDGRATTWRGRPSAQPPAGSGSSTIAPRPAELHMLLACRLWPYEAMGGSHCASQIRDECATAGSPRIFGAINGVNLPFHLTQYVSTWRAHIPRCPGSVHSRSLPFLPLWRQPTAR